MKKNIAFSILLFIMLVNISCERKQPIISDVMYADSLFSAGKYDLAREIYFSKIDNKPNDFLSYNGIGHILNRQEQYDSAIVFFTKSLKIYDKYDQAYINRGLSYFFLEEYENAISDFSAAIKFDPQSFISYYNRAKCYRYLGKYVESEADYKKIIQIDSTNAGGYLGIALIRLETNDFQINDEAYQLIMKACQLDGEIKNTIESIIPSLELIKAED